MTTTDYHTDPEYIALLERIRTDPADDAPRLILSDWLEEHGDDELAKKIRIQIANPGHRSSGNANGFYGPIVCRSMQINVIYNRGFAEESQLTCQQFCGGPCKTCQGTGIGACPDVVEYIEIAGGCPHCAGTGRIPGVARELFERHPLTRIILTCRKPLRTNIQHGNLNYWWRMAPTATTELPGSEDIPDILRKFFVSRISGGLSEYLGFNTEAAALSALFDAAVAYGRSLVGLPPLAK